MIVQRAAKCHSRHFDPWGFWFENVLTALRVGMKQMNEDSTTSVGYSSVVYGFNPSILAKFA